MATRRVAWRRSDEVATDEHCTLTQRDSGLSLVGTVLGSEGGVPVRIEYRVLADAEGLTNAAHVRDLRGFEQRTLVLERDAKGGWSVDGKTVRGLKGATDVDLGCSPSTNTLPIRRLRLGVGASKTIKAAWVRFPELTVVKADQKYTQARRVHVPLCERRLRGGAHRRRRGPRRRLRGLGTDGRRHRPG